MYRRLHEAGRPGAFINGALSLATGAAVVSGHGSWSGPGAALTAFGWLMVLKGAACFLAPDQALRSMGRRPSRSGFRSGGVALLLIGIWAGYCFGRHRG